MNEKITSGNLYEILGVSPTASAELVRLTYYTVVRKINPRTDPTRFQSISQAYSILSNEEKRREYDQQNKSGRQVRALVDQAAVMASRDPFKAMNLLQNALNLAPNMPRVHVLLGHVLMRLEKFPEAEEQYRWLLARKSNDEQMRLRLAKCLLKQERYSEAEIQLDMLFKIFPLHYEALLVFAQTLDAQDRYEEVLQVLENAIQADGVEDFHDLFALLTLLSIHGQAQRWEDVATTAIRVLKTISPDKPGQARKAAQKMLSMAIQKREEKEYDTAQALLTCALHVPLSEEDAEMKNNLQQHLNHIRLAGVSAQASEDKLIPTPLRQWIRLLYVENIPAAAREQRLGGLLKEFAENIEENPSQFLAGISYFKSEYKELAEDQARLVENLQARAEKIVAQPSLAQASSEKTLPGTSGARDKNSDKSSGFLGRFWKKTG
jgi:tetratricopeptide (TPR) repeat protein